MPTERDLFLQECEDLAESWNSEDLSILKDFLLTETGKKMLGKICAEISVGDVIKPVAISTHDPFVCASQLAQFQGARRGFLRCLDILMEPLNVSQPPE